MNVKKIYIGSWFQRTTLHLSEIYDFLTTAESPLDLDKKKLKQLQKGLGIVNVKDINEELEYIFVSTNKGVSFKIYEDGLIILSNDKVGDIKNDIESLTSYYENELSAGLKYIFSLGAPLPKELANIKNVYPYFVVLEEASDDDINSLLESFGEEKRFEIKKNTFEIYRGDKLYIINLRGESLDVIDKFIEEQVFIREFKGQMHRYLNLHRVIWENIAEVKERGSIKGKDVGEFKNKIEAYEKSINMIDTRINQMGLYINTRNKIIKNNPDMERFIDVFQFKHETLNNTLSYVKEIWKMTKRYVSSALKIFSDLQSEATNNSISNLTVVTSMGVGGTLLGLFANDKLPQFTGVGFLYFAILAFIGWFAGRVMKKIALNKNYSIQNIKIDKNIK
ncbi:MAG: hypothetical protein KAR54_01050 [Candidatus Pacebacteria bacterium]|nr:hypothetical protein [Candidatus Paceibacterota bacterium]